MRYGKDNWPLIIKDDEQKVAGRLFEFRVLPEEIVETRDRIESFLLEHSVSKAVTKHIILLFEELFMLINEKNPEKTVNAECSVILEDGKLKIIGRDDGKILHMSPEDMALDSLGAYIISRLASTHSIASHYLIAVSFNRNMFEMNIK